MFYRLLQYYIRIGLFFYFKKIRIYGLDKLPENQPLMLLPNHQNALIDPLIIAAFAPVRPYFLTRADVFANSFLIAFFKFLQMLPIYRMRDGRRSLSKNRAIFDQCGELLKRKEMIVVFPEANHNLERRVRTLSKGFTRILFHSLQRYPGLQPLLLPVGVNYRKAAGFPDSAAFYFGEPIAVTGLYDPEDSRSSSIKLTQSVEAQLRQLTTHIPEEYDYRAVEDYLESRNVDFLDPKRTNTLIAAANKSEAAQPRGALNWGVLIWDTIFMLLNWPVILLWRILVKPWVGEPEFYATHRFLLCLICYPLGYLIGVALLSGVLDALYIVLLTGGHALLNLLYVKFR